MIHLGDLPAEISQLQSHSVSKEGNGSSKIVPMSELERQTILNTIAQLNGDKLLAARMLGIGKTTLYRKLKEYSSQS
jgi:two-component system response regulator HydG